LPKTGSNWLLATHLGSEEALGRATDNDVRAELHNNAVRARFPGAAAKWARNASRARLRRRTMPPSMPLLGGLTYAPAMRHLRPTAMDAYCTEQAVLTRFHKARNAYNHEIVTRVSKDALELTWASSIAKVKRRS
jgi:hypothetical protein